MNLNKKFSIICPVYNAEKTLTNSIESVLKQTYKDWELILVDDGSKDNSGLICDEYAKHNKNIKVIHKMNEGQSKARLEGIENSNGGFVLFLDSDDEFKLNALQTINASLINDVEFLVFNATKLCKDGSQEPIYKIDDSIKNETPLSNCFCKRRVSYFWTICFKKEILKKIEDTVLKQFVKLRYCEDLFLIYNIVKKVSLNSFKSINDELYLYKSNDYSITNNQNAKRLMDRFFVFDYVYNDLFQNYRGIYLSVDSDEKNIAGWTSLSAARKTAFEFDRKNYLLDIKIIRKSFLFKKMTNFKKDKYNNVGYILLKLRMYRTFKRLVERNEGKKNEN